MVHGSLKKKCGGGVL